MVSLSVLSASQQEPKGLIPTASNQGSVRKGGGGGSPAGPAAPGSLLPSQVGRGKGRRSTRVAGTQPHGAGQQRGLDCAEEAVGSVPALLSPMLRAPAAASTGQPEPPEATCTGEPAPPQHRTGWERCRGPAEAQGRRPASPQVAPGVSVPRSCLIYILLSGQEIGRAHV